jgi:hypothetical protein
MLWYAQGLMMQGTSMVWCTFLPSCPWALTICVACCKQRPYFQQRGAHALQQRGVAQRRHLHPQAAPTPRHTQQLLLSGTSAKAYRM